MTKQRLDKCRITFCAILILTTVSHTSALEQQRRKGIITFEAALVYKSGDIKPVARTTFYLLNKPAEKALQGAGIEQPSMFRGSSFTLLQTIVLATACISTPDKCVALTQLTPFVQNVTETLKRSSVQTVTTDFTGKAKFDPAPFGVYYLVGITPTRNGAAIWNLKVELNSERVSIILDQNNADTAV